MNYLQSKKDSYNRLFTQIHRRPFWRLDEQTKQHVEKQVSEQLYLQLEVPLRGRLFRQLYIELQ
jgi:hypothetical protein